MGGRFPGSVNPTFTAQRTKPQTNFAHQDLNPQAIHGLLESDVFTYLSHDYVAGVPTSF